MTTKKSPRDPFTEFIKALEKQRTEMEKLAKPFFEYPKHMEKMVKPFWDYQQRPEKVAGPILEYQKKFLEEYKRFQEAWVRNVSETVDKLVNQMIEEQRKLLEDGNKLLSSQVNLPTHVKEYIQDLQKVQERWIEQFKKSTQMIEGFIKTK